MRKLSFFYSNMKLPRENKSSHSCAFLDKERDVQMQTKVSIFHIDSLFRTSLLHVDPLCYSV